MKIHIIENDDLEEYEKLRNKPKLRLLTNDYYKVTEEETKYTYNENYTNNFNDKIMRKILKDKVQASIYLNEWLVNVNIKMYNLSNLKMYNFVHS